MPRPHPDRELLDRFVAGRLSRRWNLRLCWHLLNCPSCRDRLAATEPGRRLAEELFGGLVTADAGGEDEHAYDAVLSRTFGLLVSRQAELGRERREAPRLIAELMRHPASRQEVLVHNTRRFHSWGLCEALLARTAEAWLEEPTRARGLAELALAVAQRLDPDHYGSRLLADLEGRCWVHLANSRRVAADHRGAERGFDEAEERLGRGTGDPIEQARLHHVKASLRRDQGRFAEAEELLERAAAAYRRMGDRHELGKVHLSLSTLHGAEGEAERAIGALERAVALIDPERDAALNLGALHNLLFHLPDLGRAMEARALLARSQELYRLHANEFLRLRLPWVEGKIALALGQLDQAEAAYVAARDGLLAQGSAYDAALCSLELAMVYARQGRGAEVKEVARAVLPLFRSLDVHREAMAAVVVFTEAAEAERATVALLREVVERLREVESRPAPP